MVDGEEKKEGTLCRFLHCPFPPYCREERKPADKNPKQPLSSHHFLLTTIHKPLSTDDYPQTAGRFFYDKESPAVEIHRPGYPA